MQDSYVATFWLCFKPKRVRFSVKSKLDFLFRALYAINLKNGGN